MRVVFSYVSIEIFYEYVEFKCTSYNHDVLVKVHP